MQHFTNALYDRDTLRIQSVAWAWGLQSDDVRDPSWPRRHHHDSIGKLDSFVDVMGDEEHCFPLLLPDADKFVLHALAR